MAKQKKRWVHSPRKRRTSVSVPDETKSEIKRKADDLIQSRLKPQYVAPPPPDPQFNYIEGINSKWYRHYFYFFSVYRAAGPYAIEGTFESKFARMEYVGRDRYNLAFMRYTEQWVEIGHDLTAEDCFDQILTDPFFHP